MSIKISRKKAEAAVAAVRGQYAAHLVEQHLDGEVYGPLYPEPQLIEDWDGPGWVIAWEEGPDEWPFLIGGGTSESDYSLYASVSAEFGTEVKPKGVEAAVMPKGVFAEAVNHCVLALYPA